MADAHTTGELVKAKAITAADLEALITAYEAIPNAGPLLLGEGYQLDVDAEINAHPQAFEMVNDPAADDAERWAVIRESLLLTRPEKA